MTAYFGLQLYRPHSSFVWKFVVVSAKSYPQQKIQIEVFDIHTVVLCNSGFCGGIIIGHPQTRKHLCKTIYTDSLAYNVMHVLLPLIIHHYTEHVLSVLVSSELNN